MRLLQRDNVALHIPDILSPAIFTMEREVADNRRRWRNVAPVPEKVHRGSPATIATFSSKVPVRHHIALDSFFRALIMHF